MKPGSFTKIYIQLVISVKYKDCGLNKSFRNTVFKIMGGILNEQGHKPILINGVEYHFHLFFGLNPKITISVTVQELKRRTTIFINNEKYHSKKFRWQYGYGAFSYSQTHIERVYNYIANQEAHHARKSFEKEYNDFLRRYEIEYEEKYLFEF